MSDLYENVMAELRKNRRYHIGIDVANGNDKTSICVCTPRGSDGINVEFVGNLQACQNWMNRRDYRRRMLIALVALATFDAVIIALFWWISK